VFTHEQDIDNALFDIDQMHKKLADHVCWVSNVMRDLDNTEIEKLKTLVTESGAIEKLKQGITDFEAMLDHRGIKNE
jgi:hypothetical protein